MEIPRRMLAELIKHLEKEEITFFNNWSFNSCANGFPKVSPPFDTGEPKIRQKWILSFTTG